MTGRAASDTLGDRLASRRRSRFVGRATELSVFRAALESDPSPFAVLYVHGPGGIGKTSLLAAYADLAAADDVTWTLIDGRDVAPSPEGILDALRGSLGVPPTSDPIDALTGRIVLLLDTYEELADADGWLRTSLLPRLPADAIVVLAGRQPPADEWRQPEWRDLVRVLPLRNLQPVESRDYLADRGMDPALCDRIVDITYGHPLGLALLADTVAQGGELAGEAMSPDLVDALLRAFVGTVPSASHRSALDVLALSRVTTESSLRFVLDADAHDLFAWLRHLSFVQAGREGLFPHDLARDALEADLHWRDPETYRGLARALRDYEFARFIHSSGREQQRALFDLQFWFRKMPAMQAMCDWSTLGQTWTAPASPEHHDLIMAMVRRWQGPEAETTAEHWWRRQPEGFSVALDSAQQIRGFLASVNLGRASEDDIRSDPDAATAWRYVQRVAPTRPDDAVLMFRFWMDRDHYMRPSATMNLGPALSAQRLLTTPNLTWAVVVGTDTPVWVNWMEFIGLQHIRDSELAPGDVGRGFFALDFRVVPFDAWVEGMSERVLSVVSGAEPTMAAPALALSQQDFAAAVRSALRDLRRTDLLARNPLTRSRLVREQREANDPATALIELITRAAEQLSGDPRDTKLYRAVEHTYLRPAGTQEKAAELLDLPFSTYRRHLTSGVERIIATLWRLELYGPSGHGEQKLSSE